MCVRIDCPRCGRPTYAGCGMHVEQALAGVPESQRCNCHEKKQPAAKPRPSTANLPWWRVGR